MQRSSHADVLSVCRVLMHVELRTSTHCAIKYRSVQCTRSETDCVTVMSLHARSHCTCSLHAATAHGGKQQQQQAVAMLQQLRPAVALPVGRSAQRRTMQSAKELLRLNGRVRAGLRPDNSNSRYRLSAVAVHFCSGSASSSGSSSSSATAACAKQ